MIVTSGAWGIGQTTCILLAKEGGRVAVTDILDKGGKLVSRVAQFDKFTALFSTLRLRPEGSEIEGKPPNTLEFSVP
jgi:NAD(P)-dependent dehydrogenase (short-subunit alcohol dehydrogenase family)